MGAVTSAIVTERSLVDTCMSAFSLVLGIYVPKAAAWPHQLAAMARH